MNHLSLYIPSVLAVNRGISKKDDVLDVWVTFDDDTVTIAPQGNAVEVMLTLEELRAIVRLFDPPAGDE